MVKADVNVKNRLIKAALIMDLFGIIVYVNANVINHVMLENIYIMQVVNAEKD